MASAIEARSSDVDLNPRITYGPAACEPPHQRPDTWQHPDFLHQRGRPHMPLRDAGT
jgi:hypothetical protein